MVEVWNGATAASTSTAYLAVEGDMGFDDPRIGVGVSVKLFKNPCSCLWRWHAKKIKPNMIFFGHLCMLVMSGAAQGNMALMTLVTGSLVEQTILVALRWAPSFTTSKSWFTGWNLWRSTIWSSLVTSPCIILAHHENNPKEYPSSNDMMGRVLWTGFVWLRHVNNSRNCWRTLQRTFWEATAICAKNPRRQTCHFAPRALLWPKAPKLTLLGKNAKSWRSSETNVEIISCLCPDHPRLWVNKRSSWNLQSPWVLWCGIVDF